MTIFKSRKADVALRDITVTQQVFEGLDQDPGRVVLIDGPTGAKMTAGELRDGISRLAGGLVARGLGTGAVVALMAPNSPQYVTVFHGVAYAGGTITTINPSYTETEVKHQLTDSGADILITIPAFLAVAEAAAAGTRVRQIVVIGGAEGHEALADLMGAPLAAQMPVDLDRHVLVLPYSSGTTGLPKGVMLSHRNLVVNVDQSGVMRDVVPGEITVGFLPFFHIYGMTVLMNMFLARGAGLVTMPRFDLEAFLGYLQAYKVRQVYIAPPVAVALAKHPLVENFDVSSVEVIFSGAAPLGAEVADAVGARLGCKVIQGYGMTEASPIILCSSDREERPGSAGPSVPNTECRIVDGETGQNLGVGQPGELWVRGPQVMLGYHNRPDATAATIQDGWLRTGDLAEVDEDGFFYIRDRLKELIKVKGFQVAPAEVEADLLTIAGIADAAVIGVPDDEAGELPLAFVVRSAGSTLTADAIRKALREKLASYKVPHRIEFIDAVPKSASGKILRRLLRDRVPPA
jgi:acyl-CoA synthetase (AMP-forming)/AMP-acid ligase II